MSEEILNQEAESPAVEEDQLQESQVEETVEVSEDEAIEEGMHGKKKKEEEYEEGVKEDAPKINIPKTKAGTIQAAVDMLKAAKKEDAQRLFAKMIKVSEAEEEDSLKSSKEPIIWMTSFTSLKLIYCFPEDNLDEKFSAILSSKSLIISESFSIF